MKLFKQLLKNSKISLQVKLIGINSFVFIVSISIMIFLATYFFRQDTEVRVSETGMRIADTLGSKVKTDFAAIMEKQQLILFSLQQELKQSGQNKELYDLLLNKDRDLFMIGVYSKLNDTLKSESPPLYNEKILKEINLTTFDLDKIVHIHSKKLLESFTGKFLIYNVSQTVRIPIFALSFPIDRDAKLVVVSIIHTNKIKEAFQQREGITETFLVNDRGDVIVHPDEKLILSEANLYEDLPIVSAMLSSKFDNGQLKYNDRKMGAKYIGSYKKVGFAGMGVVTTVLEEKAMEEVYRIQRRNLIIMAITLCISFLVIYNFSKTITTPVLKLMVAAKEIERGNFNVSIEPSSQDEVGLLTESFVDMSKGLEERDKVKNILGNMVDPVVVKEAMIDLNALKRGSEKQITAFFSDVASFSTISEKLTSVELAALLNEYLSAMTLILKEHDGVLDKYIGDAIVGIFNAPVDVVDHNLKAARASIKMIEKLYELRGFWKENNAYIAEAQAMDIRIGLNTGPAKVGFMGTDALASYTMMGDTVNLAARLEAAGKDYGVNILISEHLKYEIEKEMFTHFLDLVRVKGKNEPIRIFELVSKKSDTPRNLIEASELYEEAFKHYLKQDWDKAIHTFEGVLNVSKRNKKSVEMLIERCAYYHKSPPGDAWDGVFTRKTK